MDLRGPERDPSAARLLVDGFALALLLVAIFWVERFDAAASTIDALRKANLPPEIIREASPGWLSEIWASVALGGALLATYVAGRVISIAEGLEGDPAAWSPTVRRGFELIPKLAFGAVALWTAWQAARIAEVGGAELPALTRHVLYWGAILAAILALGGAGGAVLGDATRARASIVRVHLVFLGVLFLVVFRLPFTSAQLRDVLRAWGDGPASRASRGWRPRCCPAL